MYRELISRLVAASIASYILFLLPYLVSVFLMIQPMILNVMVLLVAMVSAAISGFLIHGSRSIIPPLAGSAASLLTNHISEGLLNISSQVYLDWPYWALGFLASPALALLVADIMAERKVKQEAESVELVKPEIEEVELMECPACGGQIPSDSIYCPLCGSRVAEER
ncbi:MAG: zinc ribbon domain-containing protein [Nitrososphaerota archaeon]